MSAEMITELERQLEAAKNPAERVFLMNRLAKACVNAEPRQMGRAIALSEAALEAAEHSLRHHSEPELKERLQRGLIESLQLLGEFYIQMAHFDLALSFLMRSLQTIKEFATEDELVMAGLFEAVSRTYSFLGEYPAGLDYALSALETYRAQLNKILPGSARMPVVQAGVTLPVPVRHLHERIAYALALVGEMQLRVGDLVESRKALEQSAEIAHNIMALAVEASALENLVHLFIEHSEDHSPQAYAQAEAWLAGSQRLYRMANDRSGEARCLICQGELNLLKGAYTPESALNILPPFQQALALAEQGEYAQEIHRALFKMGQAYHCLGQYEQAQGVLLRALLHAEQARAQPAQFEIHQWLARVYRDAGNYQRALEHHERFVDIRETVFNKQAMERVRNLQVLHQVEAARREAEMSKLRTVLLEQEIEDRRSAEASLKQVNQKLYEEIQAREQLIADLDAFAHMVAHDLKTPLTNLALSNKLLQRRAQQHADATALDLVQKSQRMVEKMNSIITELLVLASVRQERILLAELDVAALQADVRARLAYLVEESGAQIIVAQPIESWPVALGYGPWVEEVWVNYLTNAIVYGGRPPVVQIGAERLPDSMFVRFWVKDNGSGIPPEQQANLFKPFGRSAQRQMEPQDNKPLYRSTGLGLSIVRRIVEKLGGRAWVDSRGIPGEGSCFSFTLPGVL